MLTGARSEDLLDVEGTAEVFLRAARILTAVTLGGLTASGASLSLSQFRLLALIEESGQVSIEQAATALRLTEPAAAGLAGRLAVAGLVRWQPPGEGRRPVVALTPQGRDTVRRVRSWRGRELVRILRCLSPAQRGAAADAMRGFVGAAAGAGYPVGQGLPASNPSDSSTPEHQRTAGLSRSHPKPRPIRTSEAQPPVY